MSKKEGFTSLIGDAAAAVAAAPNGFVRGVIVLETKDGNFLTLTRGKGLAKAADAACDSMRKTQI